MCVADFTERSRRLYELVLSLFSRSGNRGSERPRVLSMLSETVAGHTFHFGCIPPQSPAPNPHTRPRSLPCNLPADRSQSCSCLQNLRNISHTHRTLLPGFLDRGCLGKPFLVLLAFGLLFWNTSLAQREPAAGPALGRERSEWFATPHPASSTLRALPHLGRYQTLPCCASQSWERQSSP